MKVGIDIRSLNGRKAGIGTYVAGLVAGLNQVDQINNYFLFNNREFKIADLGENFSYVISPPSPFYHLQTAQLAEAKNLIFHSTYSLIPPALLGPKAVLTVHDLTAFTLPQLHTFKVRNLNKLLFSRAVNRCGQVITPSKVIKEQLVDLFPLIKERVNVIYEAVEENFGQDTDEKKLADFGLKPGYILFNATIEPRKNLSLLLRAYAKLKPDQKLVIAGKRGWDFTRIEKEAQQLDLEEKVVWLDWVPEDSLATIYQYATCLVYPSLQEGFGLSPLKALKLGVPTIVSDIPVFKEVLANAAYYIDPNSVDSLVQGLDQIIENQSLRRDLIAKGYDQLTNYSWQKTAQETIKVYQKIDLSKN